MFEGFWWSSEGHFHLRPRHVFPWHARIAPKLSSSRWAVNPFPRIWNLSLISLEKSWFSIGFYMFIYIFSDPLGNFMYVYICLKPAKVAGLLEFSLPFAVKNMPNTTNIVAWQKSIYDDLERKRLTYADLPPVKSNMELGDLNRSNMASSNI